MSDTTQAPQIPEKPADKRKIMTPEKLERLRLAREKRAHNQLLREEKRMELAKQMVLASVSPGPGMSTQTIKVLDEKKTSPEEKKLKWDARKEAMIQEMLQKIGEANVLAMRKAKEAKEPAPETESSESELSGMEEPAAKRPRKMKTPVAKSKKTKKSSSRTDTSDRAPKKRKPVEPAVYSTSESDSASDVEHENVLQLW